MQFEELPAPNSPSQTTPTERTEDQEDLPDFPDADTQDPWTDPKVPFATDPFGPLPTQHSMKEPRTANGLGLLAILIGNLLVHFYCQNWHWVDPVRPHTVPFILIVAVALVLIREHLLRVLTMPLDPATMVLPSIVGGILAVIAYLAGLPGLEGWIPISRQGASILADLELMLLPLVTLGQFILWLNAIRR